MIIEIPRLVAITILIVGICVILYILFYCYTMKKIEELKA